MKKDYSITENVEEMNMSTYEVYLADKGYSQKNIEYLVNAKFGMPQNDEDSFNEDDIYDEIREEWEKEIRGNRLAEMRINE